MKRQEQFDPSMADAKEFQSPQAVKSAKAFLCTPQPCAKPCGAPCIGTPRPTPCIRPCK